MSYSYSLLTNGTENRAVVLYVDDKTKEKSTWVYDDKPKPVDEFPPTKGDTVQDAVKKLLAEHYHFIPTPYDESVKEWINEIPKTPPA